jgi:hypothetical protein
MGREEPIDLASFCHHAILSRIGSPGIVKLIIRSEDDVPFFLQSIEAFLEFAASQSAYKFSMEARESLARLKEQICTVKHYADVTDESTERHAIVLPVRNLTRARHPSFLGRLTPTVIESVNRGTIKLIFDFSNEATSSIAIKRYVALLRQIGITNLEMVHWICGNQLLPKRLFGIHHHVFNYFEMQVYVDLMTNLGISVFEQLVTARYSIAKPFIPRILCLNATPREERVAAMLSLFKEGVINTTDYTEQTPNLPFLSFGGFGAMKTGGVMPEAIREWLMAHEMHDLIPYLEWISDKKLVVDNFKKRGNGLFNKVDVSVYDNTCLSYVTETTMSPELSRFTEKSLKPLLLGHPVIVAGTIGNIQLLRQLGFSVFDHVIDHSYDRESDVVTRIRMSAKEVKSFLDRSSEAGSTLIEEVIPHVRANIEWGLYGYPLRLYRNTMELFQSI